MGQMPMDGYRISRIAFLSTILISAAFAGLFTGADSDGSADAPPRNYDIPGDFVSWFTLCALPDTQVYSMRYPHIYTNQTWWIANHTEELNIKYVIHEGDITNNNNHAQWTNANESMRKMDDAVPYTLTPGNHDIGPNGRASTRETYLNDYFPAPQYENWTTYGGEYESGHQENTYHIFKGGGWDFMILVLEFAPRDAVLEWANQVVSDHPGHLVIVATHNYLAGNVRNPGLGGDYGVADDPAGANSGDQIWQKFVRKHRNIISVLSGHILIEAGYLMSQGDHGNRVYQMMANFQMNSYGGNGFFRLLHFDTLNQTIQVRTYSPYLDQFRTESYHQFNITIDRWNYVNDPPYVLNDLSELHMEEDQREAFIDLDGDENPGTGIFSDINIGSGDGLVFQIFKDDQWATISKNVDYDLVDITVNMKNNRSLRITPDENFNGEVVIPLKAVDMRGGEVIHNVTVSISPVNDPPILMDMDQWTYHTYVPEFEYGVMVANEDMYLNFTILAHDPVEIDESGDITFRSNATPENNPFFHLDRDSGNVSILPGNEDVGSYTIVITADDGGDVNNLDEMILKLRVDNVNDPPVYVGGVEFICYEDESFSFDLNATDIDPTDDRLTWSLNTETDFIRMDPDTGVMYGTPTNDNVGRHEIIVSVQDEEGASDTRSLFLTVINTNDPPTVSEPPVHIEMNEDISYEITDLNEWFNDIDGDILEFDFISDDNITAEIDGTRALLIPRTDWSGNGMIRIMCSDGEYSTGHDIQVEVDPVNDPPSECWIELQEDEYREGGIQLFSGGGNDPDLSYGDSLYFSWFSNISGLLGQSREINLSLISGHHLITLTASDRLGESLTAEVQVFVLPMRIDNTSTDDDTDDPDGDKPSDNDHSPLIATVIGFTAVLIIIIVLIIVLIVKRRTTGDVQENGLETDDIPVENPGIRQDV